MGHPWIVHTAWAALAMAGIGTTIAGLARLGWPFELACHFRLQYALLACASAVLFGGAHAWPVAALALGLALINLRALGPLTTRRAPPPSDRTYRLLMANVWRFNPSPARLERLIRQAAPDVIVLLEMTPRWLAALRHFETDYPYSKAVIRGGGFGILCLSRLPLESAAVVRIGRVGLPSVVVRMRLDGKTVTVVAAHPLSPLKHRSLSRRNRQLEAIAHFIGQQSGPLVLVGDLNATPWSPMFRDLLRLSKLRDSRVGFGLQASWPVWVPLIRIPIDHCLVSSDLMVHRRARGPSIGSDHFPVFLDFSLSELHGQ